MNKVRYVILDNAAAQAAEMANLSTSSDIVHARGNPIPRDFAPDAQTLFVAGEASTLDRLDPSSMPTGASLLFYETDTTRKSVDRIMQSSGMNLISVQIESLPALALSRAIKEFESLLIEGSAEDFSLGEVSAKEVLKPESVNRLFFCEGRHLREAVLRMAHTIRGRHVNEGVAYVLHLPLEIPLFALDEALDVLEMATMPQSPVHFAIRFNEKKDMRIYISAFAITPPEMADEMQMRIDAQPTYLGKLAIIVEHFAGGKIDEKQMEKLCHDNGLDRSDADRLYDIFYTRSDETADLMRRLRETQNGEEKIEMVAKALADNFIDARILEELSIYHSLSPEAVIIRAQTKRHPL